MTFKEKHLKSPFRLSGIVSAMPWRRLATKREQENEIHDLLTHMPGVF